jgi:hypothetical protein
MGIEPKSCQPIEAIHVEHEAVDPVDARYIAMLSIML